MRPTLSNPSDLPRLIIEVDGCSLEPPPAPETISGRDAAQAVTGAVRDSVELVRSHGEAGAPRSSEALASNVKRQRAAGEVIRASRLDPEIARIVVEDGALFGEPLPHLRFSPPSAVEHTWPTRLRTVPYPGRACTLQIQSSPSHNLTLVQLIPRTRRLLGERSFIRAGARAVEAIVERLERLGVELLGEEWLDRFSPLLRPVQPNPPRPRR